ncbi:MAG: DUF262 domain-containing protein [Candidatus Electrothrix sp. AR1]|nr:DUF262 domain-containing protein [Candidatus Electrothrix sp. AR1]
MKNVSLKRDSNSISIANLFENHLAGKYDDKPSYQRESVWSEEKQSFLIDSIMRNFPMPPIFLRQKIDDETGKTSYEIIDGKQRLTSIIKFINNEIPISSEEEPVDDEYEEVIAGLFFNELDGTDETKEFKRKFWRYHIPIEYIDTNSDNLIKNIFDRLNRNGEPLKGQELRNARFNENFFHKKVIEISLKSEWKRYLSNVDVVRMENTEFIAELLFEVGEKKPLHATQDVIDEKYEFYSKKNESEINDIISEFNIVIKFIEDIKIESYCKKGVSHFYGIWCFAHYCIMNDLSSESIKDSIQEFYAKYTERRYDSDSLIDYKKSMSSNTKSSNQRVRRRDALISYCI